MHTELQVWFWQQYCLEFYKHFKKKKSTLDSHAWYLWVHIANDILIGHNYVLVWWAVGGRAAMQAPDGTGSSLVSIANSVCQCAPVGNTNFYQWPG